MLHIHFKPNIKPFQIHPLIYKKEKKNYSIVISLVAMTIPIAITISIVAFTILIK
jgi:hypothetical protein